MSLYTTFFRLPIDFAAIGLIQRSDSAPYFCTPQKADVIGWAGVDGIHYCFLDGFGETVFAVSPMNDVGAHVHPIARNFEDFLRLLLACRDFAAVEQAWQWSERAFFDFVNGICPTDEQKQAFRLLETTLHLTPMEAPYNYLKGLCADFDYRAIPFSAEYYDTVGEEPLPSALWQVTFDGGLFGSPSNDCPGEEIAVNRRFAWEGERWVIPAVYACRQGLVVDICAGVEASAVRDFMEKWGSFADKGDQMTAAQRRQMHRENPLQMDFRATTVVNGREMRQKRGSSVAFLPESVLEKGMETPPEARRVIGHYGLDEAMAWSVHRISFPWGTGNKPQINSILLKLAGTRIPLAGEAFPTPPVGGSVDIVHPITGVCHCLTVDSVEATELQMDRLPSDLAFPTHLICMSYRITPELSDRTFVLRDAEENDPPRPKQTRTAQGSEFGAASIGIIGGADGPTAIIFGQAAQTEKSHAACSALRFSPPEKVMWQPVFMEKLRRDMEIELL